MTTATDRILDALASDYLLELKNHGNTWSITFCDERGEGTISDAHFDKLLERWHETLADIHERADKAKEEAA